MDEFLNDFKEKDILDNVQAGIIKPLGRHYKQFIFLKFSDNLNKVKEFIKKYQPTSTKTQLNITEDFKNGNTHKSLIINFYFSHSGFEKIGFSNFFSNSERAESTNHYFWKGMQHRDVYPEHKDPSPEENKYEENYQNLNDIHALIVLSSDDKSIINAKQLVIADDLFKKSAGKILFFEEGEKMTRIVDGKKVCIEPFGYQDGITDIKFFNKKTNKLNRELLPLVLGEYCQSYLVFRKLYQDVEKFNSEVLKLAARLKGKQSNPIDFIEGQIMGRFKNGVPILYSSSSASTEADICQIDKFNKNPYSDKSDKEKPYSSYDQDGLKCPISAHIRKANPRDGTVNNSYGKPAVIIRRGIPFKYSDKKQGLLFACFQAIIEAQFSMIQGKWLESDVIAGNKSKTQKWNSNWNESSKSDKVKFSFKEVVTFKGGEFFYAPPLFYFQNPLPSKGFATAVLLKDHLEELLSNMK